MRYLPLCILFILPSCGLLRSLEQNSTRVGEVLAQVKEATTKAEATYKEVVAAAAEADTDGDGKTSMDEWLAWVFGGLLGGGGLIARGAIRNAKSDGRKDRMEDRLVTLETKA